MSKDMAPPPPPPPPPAGGPPPQPPPGAPPPPGGGPGRLVIKKSPVQLALEAAAAEARAVVERGDPTEIQTLRTAAAREQKRLEAAKVAYTSTRITVIPGKEMARAALYAQVDKTIKGIDNDIREKETLVNNLAASLQIVSTNPAAVRTLNALLAQERSALAAMQGSRDSTVASIQNFAQEYRRETARFEQEKNIQTKYISIYDSVKTAAKSTPNASKTNTVAEQFKLQSREFSDFSKYTKEEQILLKVLLYEKGEKEVFDKTPKQLSDLLTGQIQAKKFTYEEFKNAIGGRPLFIDEADPQLGMASLEPQVSAEGPRSMAASSNSGAASSSVQDSAPSSSSSTIPPPPAASQVGIGSSQPSPSVVPPPPGPPPVSAERAPPLTNTAPQSPSAPVAAGTAGRGENNNLASAAAIAARLLGKFNVNELYKNANVDKRFLGYRFKRSDRKTQITTLDTAIKQAKENMATNPTDAIRNLKTVVANLKTELEGETRHLGESRLAKVITKLEKDISAIENAISPNNERRPSSRRP